MSPISTNLHQATAYKVSTYLTPSKLFEAYYKKEKVSLQLFQADSTQQLFPDVHINYLVPSQTEKNIWVMRGTTETDHLFEAHIIWSRHAEFFTGDYWVDTSQTARATWN